MRGCSNPYSLTEARILYELAHLDVSGCCRAAAGIGPGRWFLRSNRPALRGRRPGDPAAFAGGCPTPGAGDPARQGRVAVLDARLRSKLGALPHLTTTAALKFVAGRLQCAERWSHRRPHRLPCGHLARAISAGSPHATARSMWYEFGWDDIRGTVAQDSVADYVDQHDRAERHGSPLSTSDNEVRAGVLRSQGDDATAQLCLLLVEPDASGSGARPTACRRVDRLCPAGWLSAHHAVDERRAGRGARRIDGGPGFPAHRRERGIRAAGCRPGGPNWQPELWISDRWPWGCGARSRC